MRLTKDFLSGLMFIGLGIGAAVIGGSYRLGTLAQMGPGYFPLMLGTIIAAIGALIAGRAALFPESSEPVEGFSIRPLTLILAAVICFGLLIRSYGLIASVVALVLVSSLSRSEGSWLELAIMLVVLTLIPVAVFIYGLGLPFQLWFF